MPIYAEYYLDAIAVQADQFRLALFDYPVMAKSYLITQTMSAGVVRLPIWASWFSLGFIVLGFSLVNAALAYTKGVGQYVMLGVLALAIFGLKLPFLFGASTLGQYTFMIALVVCTLAVYVVHNWLEEASFIRRWILLGLPMILAAVWYVIKFDGTEVAAAKVLATGGTTFFFTTVGFLLISAPGLVVWVYKLLTKSPVNSPTKNVSLNLTVFVLIYCVNLLLSLASNRWGFHIGITVFGPTFLFPVTVVAGWFGMQIGERLYMDSSDSFLVMGRWLYTGLAMVSIAFWGWAFATNNDSLIRLLNDVLLVSQLAFCLMYLAYIYINFGGLFGQMSNLYKVLYKPVRMPYWVIWLGVIFGMFAYVKATFNVPVLQYYSALLNAQAMVAYHQNDLGTASDLFQLAAQEDVEAQLSMFGKAAVAASKYDHIRATEILIDGLEYKGSPQAYLMLAQQYQDANRPKDQVATLYVAREFFPDHWSFCNNLALFYHQHQGTVASSDSVKKYLLLAKKMAPSNPVLVANELALEAQTTKVNLRTATENGPSQDMPYLNNLLAVANAQGTALSQDNVLDYAADSTLHQLSFSYLYNYGINRVLADDTAAATIVKFYSKTPNAREFMKALNEAKAISYIRTGLRAKALMTLRALSNGGQEAEFAYLYGQALAMSGSVFAAMPNIQSQAMGSDMSGGANSREAIAINMPARLLYAELSAIAGQTRQADALMKLINPTDLDLVLPVQPGHVSEAIAFDQKGSTNYAELTVGGRIAMLAYFRTKYADDVLTQIASGISEPNLRLLAYALIYPGLRPETQQAILALAVAISNKEQLDPKMSNAIWPLWVKALAGNPDGINQLKPKAIDDHAKSLMAWGGFGISKGTKTSQRIHQAWPLDRAILTKAIDNLNAETKRDLAYDLILNYLEFEPNPPMWASRVYITQCFKLRLRSFAADQLRTYKAKATGAEWAQLVTELKALDPAYDGTILTPIE